MNLRWEKASLSRTEDLAELYALFYDDIKGELPEYDKAMVQAMRLIRNYEGLGTLFMMYADDVPAGFIATSPDDNIGLTDLMVSVDVAFIAEEYRQPDVVQYYFSMLYRLLDGKDMIVPAMAKSMGEYFGNVGDTLMTTYVVPYDNIVKRYKRSMLKYASDNSRKS